MARRFVVVVPRGAEVIVRHPEDFEGWQSSDTAPISKVFGDFRSPPAVYEAMSDEQMQRQLAMRAEADRISAEEPNGPWRETLLARFNEWLAAANEKPADSIDEDCVFATEALLRSAGKPHVSA